MVAHQITRLHRLTRTLEPILTLAPPREESTPSWETMCADHSNKLPRRRPLLASAMGTVIIASVLTVTLAWQSIPKANSDTKLPQIAPASEQDVQLVEAFIRFLKAPSLDDKLATVLDAGRLRPHLERYHQLHAIVPPWLHEEAKLRDAYSVRPVSGAVPPVFEVTLFPTPEFPVSAYFEKEEDGEWRLDWQSFAGYGDCSLEAFFASQATRDTTLRVKLLVDHSNAVLQRLPRDRFQRVRLSDLEGLVKGWAYIRRDHSFYQELVQLVGPENEEVKVTITAHYQPSLDSTIAVPVITNFVRSGWRTPRPAELATRECDRSGPADDSVRSAKDEPITF